MTTLLITRPRGQARPLARSAQAHGWRAVCLPIYHVRTIGSDAERRALLEARSDASWWIFTSVNAVAATRRAAPAQWPRRAAIGAATARALDEAGYPADAVPEGEYTTEALLALPAFEDVADQHIVIVGNEAARPALREQLDERGARVEPLAVYRLEEVQYSTTEVASAVNDAGITVLTSASAAERLWSLADAATRRRLARMPLVVPSERVSEQCTRRGMHGPHAVAQPMSNAALLAAADTLPTMQNNDDETRAKAGVDPQQASDAVSPDSATTVEPAGDSSPEGGADHAVASASEAGNAPASGAVPAGSHAESSPGAVPPASPAPPPPPAPRRGGGMFLVLLLWLLLLVGALAAGWWGWQQLQAVEQVSRASAERVTELDERIAGQDDNARDARLSAHEAVDATAMLEEQMSALDERVAGQSEQLAKLSDIVDAGRAQAHIVATEQLLMAASERLQLGRDPVGARRALQLADRRLAALEDPRFFEVREALAAEMAALRAVETVDRTALVLEINALIARAEGWRLLGGVPDASAPTLPEQSAGADETPAWKRALNSVHEALASVFVVRRTDEPVEPLIDPERSGLVRSVLLLRLESARAALLAREQATFDSALDAVVDWLRSRFAVGDADVDAAIASLEAMRGRTLAPELPDISASLARLRAATDTGADDNASGSR